jgi:hypothetical protein
LVIEYNSALQVVVFMLDTARKAATKPDRATGGCYALPRYSPLAISRLSFCILRVII